MMDCFNFIRFFLGWVGIWVIVLFSDFHQHNLLVTGSEDFELLLVLFLF